MRSKINLLASEDILASFVVFLVALPLSLGIALASGAPAVAGVVAAAIGGIVVGFFAGVPLQVSGPAAGLTVLVFDFIQKFGFKAVCGVTAVGGLLQIVFGSARVAKFALKIPSPVIHGMLSGIGFIITFSQAHVLLGGTPQSSALRNFISLPLAVLNANWMAALLGLFSLFLILFWKKGPIKALHRIPSPLVGVGLGTVLALVLDASVTRVNLPENLIPVFSLPEIPHHDMVQLIDFSIAALTLALIASTESLVSAVAVDKMHAGPKGNLNRELIAQGVGNLTSGLFGGLPITGVIVRSSANVASGAKTRTSAILHGVWIVVFVLFFAQGIRQIPLCVLSGLLIQVGMNLMNPKQLKHFHHRTEYVSFFITMGGVVAINLLAGIILGIAFETVLYLYKKYLR